MNKTLAGAAKRWWLVVVVWLVICAAAPPILGQACCRCDRGGGTFGSCNTGGIPNQATCEGICASQSEMFGQFQTCPAGMVFGGCSQPPDPPCNAICSQATPGAAAAPAVSTTGTLLGTLILVGLGAYTLRRRSRLSSRLNS